MQLLSLNRVPISYSSYFTYSTYSTCSYADFTSPRASGQAAVKVAAQYRLYEIIPRLLRRGADERDALFAAVSCDSSDE